MDQSSEEEVLVWVFPNHESKTSDLEKPILALPIGVRKGFFGGAERVLIIL